MSLAKKRFFTFRRISLSHIYPYQAQKVRILYRILGLQSRGKRLQGSLFYLPVPVYIM